MVQKLSFICFFVLLGFSFPQTKPNILLFFIDDMGWTDVGFNEKDYYTPRYYQTPNIDQLASEGMVFSNAYANAGNCAPSRAALLSGQYSPRTNVYTVGSSNRLSSDLRATDGPNNTNNIETSIVTFAEALKPAGYVTIHLGKWHMGPGTGEKSPTDQGFDFNIGGNNTGFPKSYFSPYNNGQLTDGPIGEYLPDRIGDEAVKFLNNHKDTTFLMYYSPYAVHGPMRAPDSLKNIYSPLPTSAGHDNSTYAAMIHALDYNVGKVLGTLKKLALEDNTVVIFFSDNGGPQDHTSNVPLRGAKGMLYEGGIREPFIVRWPGKVMASSTNNTPIIATDLYKTFLDLAGAMEPQNHILDGESIVPLFTETGSLNRQAIYWHSPIYLTGSGDGGGRSGFRTAPTGAVRMGDYKLIEFFEFGQLELYNIREDIGETNNLVKSHPNVVSVLRDSLKAWQTATSAPLPIPNSGFDNSNAPDPSTYTTWDDIKDQVDTSVTKIKKSLTKFDIHIKYSSEGISVQLPESFLNAQLELFDIRGNKIISTKVENKESIFISNQLVSNVLLIKVKINEKEFIQKIIKLNQI